MSKRSKHGAVRGGKPPAPLRKPSPWVPVLIVLVTVGAAAFWIIRRPSARPESKSVDLTKISQASTSSLPVVEVAQSLMSAVELDFGAQPPSVRDALKEIERYHQPDSGQGRTFAVLDADGFVAPNGKLRLQMHLSMERPGLGSLVFKRTGEVLWKSRIVASTNGPPKPRQLAIYMANTAGQSFLLDGSKGPRPVLDLPINATTSTVRDLWPDGAEHEFTFVFSVCGCPVKAKVRRAGETTARTSELPVMFPDDPEALRVIHQVMGWPVAP